MNTEFGVSHITSRGSAGAPAASAAAFVADVRQLSEQVGLGCITLHEMQGSQFAVSAGTYPFKFDASMVN